MATGDRLKAVINVTPLVDIVLVLLIIFIVITPAVNDTVRLPIAKHGVEPGKGSETRRLRLTLLTQRGPNGMSRGPGLVCVDDTGGTSRSDPMQRFSLAERVDRARLRAIVAASVGALRDKRVFIRADADLPFHYVNELFQVCREGGGSDASIVTSADERPEGRRE